MTHSAESQSESFNGQSNLDSSTSFRNEVYADLNDFNSMHDSMSSKPGMTLAHFDGANGPTFENAADDKAVKSDSDSVIVPDGLERYKTPQVTEDLPVIHKGGEGETLDDQGNVINDKTAKEGVASIESVTTKLDGAGKLKSIESYDHHNQEKSSIQVTADGVTRTRETVDGKEVTKFGKDGKPISAEVTLKGSSEVQKVEPNPNDRLTVSTNENGETVVTSQEGERKTKITVGKNGLPKHRIIEAGNVKAETTYDDSGKPQEEVAEQYDDKGNVRRRDRITASVNEEEFFDDKGKLVKTVQYDGSYKLTHEKQEDGTSISSVENNQTGETTKIIQSPDGTTTKISFDGDSTNTISVIKPNGTEIIRSEDSEITSRIYQDKDGNWVNHILNKNTGRDQTLYGNGDETYGSRVTYDT